MLFLASTAIEFGPVPLAGWDSPGAPKGSPTPIVFTTWLLLVSMTDRVSLYALATSRYLPHNAIPVGCRPVEMLPVSVKEARSTTETVPVDVEPVGNSATTGVPLEYCWKSSTVAIRPASLET